MQALDQMQLMDKDLREALYKHKWIVNIQEPYAPAEAMLRYLGRYTHKIAISNHRILDISQKEVSFSYLDYRDNQQKQMSLSGVEFLRRFVQHILPKRFVRVRYYGILSASRKQQYREILLRLGKVPKEKENKDWKQVCREKLHFDPDICPCCGKGKMITIDAFRRRAHHQKLSCVKEIVCHPKNVHKMNPILYCPKASKWPMTASHKPF